MSCGEVREKLPLYAGGDLDAEVLEAVHEHLEQCSACASQGAVALRARRELVAAFRQHESLASAPGLWPGIRATLRAEGLIREASDPVRLPSGPARSRRPHWTWALAPVAAAAALLLATQLGGGSLERGAAPKTIPVAEAPGPSPAAEVVLAPSPESDTGALKRLPPGQVRPLRAFEPNQGQLAPGGDASLAGFRGRDVK